MEKRSKPVDRPRRFPKLGYEAAAQVTDGGAGVFHGKKERLDGGGVGAGDEAVERGLEVAAARF